MKMISMIVAIPLACCLACHEACKAGESDATLLDGLRFGLKKQEVMSLPQAREGEGDFKGEVILPELNYAGMAWTGRLEFRKNMRLDNPKGSEPVLARVCLVEKYSRARYEAVYENLRSDGFELLAMQAAGGRLDFIALLKAFGAEELQKRISGIYERDDLNFLAFAWFDTRKISREMKVMARNLNELLQVISADTREAEVILTGEKGKITHIQVIFSLPILEIQTFGTSG